MARVLFADDHEWFRAVALAMLEGERFTIVAEVDRVATACAAILATRPELVVLDVQLVDGTGCDVISALGPLMPPTVLVSSRPGATYGGRMRASGALGFIAKVDLDADALAALVGGAT